MPAASGADLVPRRAWVVFVAVSACSFQTSLALSIINVAFPSIRDDFPDVSQTALSWVVNLYTIVGGASLIVASVLVERIGRKRMLMIGTAGFAVGSLVCALAPTIVVLLAGRVIQALASAVVTPASVALIVPEFPDSHRPTAVAAWAASGSLAASIGPALGGLLVDAGGWRWAFWILLPGGLIGFTLVGVLLKESRDADPRPLPDLLGAVLIVTSVGLIIGGLVQSRPWGWDDARVPAAIVVGAALVGVLVRRSRTHPSPVLDTGLFRKRTFAVASVGSFVFGTGFFAVFFGYVLFLTDVWHRSARAAGLLMTPLAVCGAFLSPLAGRWVRRRGPQVPLVVGGLAFAAGAVVLLVFAGDEPHVLGVWLPAIVATGTGAALIWPCLFASVVAEVPRDRYSVATGINQTVQRASTAFGVALAVTVLGTTVGGSAATFRWLFAICIASGLATAATAPSLRPRPARR